MDKIEQPTGPTTTFRKPRVRRRWPWIVGGVIALLAVLAAVFYFAGRPLIIRIAKGELDRRLAEVSEAIGRKVVVSGLAPTLTEEIVLERVQIPGISEGPPTLIIPRVRFDFSLWDALLGRRAPNRVVIEGLRLNVTMEGAASADLTDLLHGLQRYREHHKSQSGGSGGGGRFPEIEVRNATILVLQAGTTGAAGTLRELNIEIRRGDAGALEAEFQGVAAGLSATAARVTGIATGARDGSLYVNVDFDQPLELTRLLGTAAPVALSLTGATLERDVAGGRVAAGVRGVRVADTTPVLVREPMSRFAAAGGPFTADELKLEVAVGEGGGLGSLRAAGLSALRSVTVRNAATRFTPSRGKWTSVETSGIAADVTRDAATGDLVARGEATLDLGAGGPSRVRGEVRMSPGNEIKSAEAEVSGPLLVQAISAFHPRLLPWDGARLDAKVSLTGDGKVFHAKGFVEGRGLAYFWTKLCLAPITDVAFQADFTADVNLSKETVHLSVDPIQVKLAHFALDLDLERFTSTPKVKARFAIPRQSCQAVATAVPPIMIPRLEGAVLSGWMGFEIRAAIDLKNVYNATLDIEPDLGDCTAITLGPLVDVDVLAKRFTHRVVEDDLDEPILTGPATADYVPIDQIPEVVQQAALATEDMAFFKHHGFVRGLIKRAISLNLDKGWYVYGGSSISQQLVKNLFLSREKTLSRKLEEAVIVWQMEDTLEKERILELYLNIVEFGKHIYGIKAAASAYFNKAPKDLTPLEAAWIMATKPSPRYAHAVYKKRQFNEWWVLRMDGILKRLWSEMNIIDEATYREAAPYLPTFWYPEDGSYRRPEVSGSFAVPPGMPAELPKEPKLPPPGAENAPAAEAQPAPEAGHEEKKKVEEDDRVTDEPPEPPAEAKPEKKAEPKVEKVEKKVEPPAEEPAPRAAPAPAPAPSALPPPPPPPT